MSMESANGYDDIREAYLANGRNKVPAIKICMDRYDLPMAEAKAIVDKIANEAYYAEAEKEGINPQAATPRVFRYSFIRYVRSHWILLPIAFLFIVGFQLLRNPDSYRAIQSFFESRGLLGLMVVFVLACGIFTFFIPVVILSHLITYPKLSLSLESTVLYIAPYERRHRARGNSKYARTQRQFRNHPKKNNGKHEIDYVTSYKEKYSKIIIYGYEDYHSAQGEPTKKKIVIPKVFQNHDDLLKRLEEMSHHD